ncbi:hypothetical protein MTO96_027867 [Rhipicephalus appendiculatus]
MESHRTKRTILHVELETLSKELTLLKTRYDLGSDKEECIATVKYELDAIAKELKQQDELIEPHVNNDDFVEEYAGVRKYQALITSIRTRLGRLQRKSVSGGGADNGSATAVSSIGNAGPLTLPELECQKTSGDRDPMKTTPFQTPSVIWTRVRCRGAGRQQRRKEHSSEVLEIKDICSGQQEPLGNVVHLNEATDIQLTDGTLSPTRDDHKDMEILERADTYWCIVTSGEVRSLQGVLAAVNTDLGWTLQGPIAEAASVVYLSVMAVLRTSVVEPVPNISSEVRAFREIESHGITMEDCQSGDNEHLKQDLIHSLSFTDGRYDASLPWKLFDWHFESNNVVARGCPTSLPTREEQPTASTTIEPARQWKYRQKLDGLSSKHYQAEHLCAYDIT